MLTDEGNTIVVGGGLAGLTAANLLADRRSRVVLLEQSKAPGGRARTTNLEGYRFNLGPHALYRAGAAWRILTELGIEPIGGRNPDRGLVALYRGRRHLLPTGAWSLLVTSLISLQGKMEAARFLSSLGRVRTGGLLSVSAAEWVDRTFRAPEVREFIHALLRLSTYVNAPELLSAGAALRQLQRGAESGVVYLHGGWQTLVDRLVVRARESGVRIVTESRVEGLELDGLGVARGVRVQDGRVFPARNVILAVDPRTADSWLGRREEAAGGRFDSCVPARASCLDLALDSLPDPGHPFALGIDRPLYLSVHTHSARLSDSGGAVVHLARYLRPEEKGDEETERELEEMMDLVQPGWKNRVVHRRFLPDMLVMHDIPQSARGGTRGRTGTAVSGVPGVHIVGDWVGDEGMLADAALASAYNAVETILGSEIRGQATNSPIRARRQNEVSLV